MPEHRNNRGPQWRTLALRILTKTAVLILALLYGFVALAVYYLVGDQLLEKLYTSFGLRSDVNWPLVVGYRQIRYYLQYAYPITCAVAAFAIFWNGSSNIIGRMILYLFLILVIGPATYINYRMSDQWLNIWLQALINVFIAIGALACIYILRSIKSKSADMMAFQSIAVLCISTLGVALPLFYSSIFFSFKFGLLSRQQISDVNEQIPMIFSLGVGAVITLITQLDKLRDGSKVAD